MHNNLNTDKTKNKTRKKFSKNYEDYKNTQVNLLLIVMVQFPIDFYVVVTHEN